MKHAIRHIHFIGIGGSGMSGIAEVLLNLGYQVSGSDLSDSATLRRLASLGIETHVGHVAGNVKDADAVVTSTAVKSDNPDVLAGRERHIPIVPRAVVLAEAGLDPTFVIGGRLNSAGANAKLGTGDYIVVEADESDASFLNLLPVMAVVTNIDADHMETYGHDFGRLKSAFVDFLHRMPFYGTAIVCTDDPGVKSIVDEIARPVTTYGFNEGAQVRAVNVRAEHGQMHFTVRRRDDIALPDLEVVLNLAGEHNVRNALAAIAVAVELNVPDEAVLRALAAFKGVGRRFQRYGEVRTADGQGRFTVIDDFGHHPVEMAATLAAARGAFPGRRLVLAFQPHRYSRTRDCFEDFVKVIGQGCDTVLLSEVYAAGEAPIVAADGRALTRALRVAGKVEPVFVEEIAAMPQAIADFVRDGDVVIAMGAGSIGAVPQQVVDLVNRKEGA